MMFYSPSERFMASQAPGKPSQPRPGITRLSSFSSNPVPDENDSLKPPKRAHTFQNGSPVEKQHSTSTGASHAPDAFETADGSDDEAGIEITRASIELDELPIELISLTDNFIESLSAKVHSTPPNIEKLSQLFQDFYALAASHINTHISALASKRSRDASPGASTSSISSAASRLKSRAASFAKEKPKSEAEQQMLTAEELADRRRARKALEGKRTLLEEAVERRLCEGIYDRLYRHRSTQDEAQDDKLRSKTAALALVGIGPVDLGIDLGDDLAPTPEAAVERSTEIRERLSNARRDLVHMAESKYPLGKLNRLKAAHRSIVDTLAHFHPSASADEIMPMLIYTLITLPPENLHVISDVHFIQYFRSESKLTGEAAYCLTNLEAAISFLENVDLATLREDEHLSGPPKLTGDPGTPKTETFPPAYPQGPNAASQAAVDTKGGTPVGSRPPPSTGLKPNPILRNRRLSDLVNTPAQAFGAASDAVMNTADQGLKTISNSLGESYKFLLGKLKEEQESPRESITVPRTLDDARKLVSTPPIEDEDEIAAGSLLDPNKTEGRRSNIREDRVLNLIGGNRDRSADSARSGRSASSSKKPVGADDTKPAPTPPTNPSPAMLEQMRTLSNSFNPMARLSNMSMIRGFGRNASNPPTPVVAPKEVAKPADGGDLATAFPDIAAALPPKQITKVAPPNRRFMEVQTPGDLKLAEVVDLLRDYRRLAGALKNLGAFEEA
ncbi:Vacuolar protein sorting-associated protein 9b [Paramyrothecium foliicola]|nr:Vacuolar protein sorting-associated protein 9b [Paramyrothecium foliicola]